MLTYDLFNKNIVPILLNGDEVLGFTNNIQVIEPGFPIVNPLVDW